MQLDIQFIWTALQVIVRAIPMTLLIAITPLFIGLLIGLIVTFIRQGNKKLLKAIANFYVSFYRGTPVIMHIFIIYFGMPLFFETYFNISLHTVPIVLFVILALSLNAGAFLAEIIRSGVMSVGNGQIEAAYSLGMTTFNVYRRIIFPQAFVTVIPNLTNIVVAFLHSSSIAFLVSVKEMTGAANIIASSNLKYLEAFIAVGLVYWVVSILIEFSANKIEVKLTKHLKRGVVHGG